MLDNILEKTVSLINTKIPLPVKKISFAVSDSYSFVYGDFIKSKEESGSVEFKLW